MLNEIRGVVRLRGHRGRPPADEPSLVAAVVRVAALLESCPEIQEMDVNPISVLERGVIAIDVRIRVHPLMSRRSTRRVRY